MELFLLGDSITFGFKVKNKDRFDTIFAKKSEVKCYNYGVPGDATGGMLTRLLTDIFPKMKESLKKGNNPQLFIMGGGNDILYTGSCFTARANLGSMIHESLAKGFSPRIALIPPFVEKTLPMGWETLLGYGDIEKEQTIYNNWISNFCELFDLKTIDMNTIFFDNNGQINYKLFIDGIHPNEDGHRKMAENLYNGFADMLSGVSTGIPLDVK